MPDVFDELANTLITAAQATLPRKARGELGGEDDNGSYALEVAAQSGRVYARELNGLQTEALNLGVPILPDFPVFIYTQHGVSWVTPDPERLEAYIDTYGPVNAVAPHTHEAGFGNFDVVSQRRLRELQVVCTNPPSMSVKVIGGRYITASGAEATLLDTEFDLTSYVPATTDHHAWVKVGINATTGVLTAAEMTSSKPISDPLTDGDAVDISFTGNIPLAIVRLYDGISAVDGDNLIRDWRFIFQQQGAGSLASAVILSPDSTTRNRIQPTGAAYPALILRNHASQSAAPFQHVASDGTTLLASIDPSGNAYVNRLAFHAAAELTIAAGAITVTAGYHTIDTEADAASDDLDDINGLDEGVLVCLRASNTARTVVIKNNANIVTNTSADITLDDDNKWALFIGKGGGVALMLATGGGGGGSLTVEEADGTPSVTATTIKFPDASLTNEGSGVVRFRAQQQIVFAVAGDLTVAGQPFRVSNNFGRTLTIKGVYLNVNTAPTGASITVDINKNGTTIFTTQANRPAIAASANSGSSTTIDVTTWSAGDYLTMDVDQIGSTIAGANLTVHVLVEG